ncbi:MAG: hypothetical protein U0800_11055 [Isosphaeraceae bacterium]
MKIPEPTLRLLQLIFEIGVGTPRSADDLAGPWPATVEISRIAQADLGRGRRAARSRGRVAGARSSWN